MNKPIPAEPKTLHPDKTNFWPADHLSEFYAIVCIIFVSAIIIQVVL